MVIDNRKKLLWMIVVGAIMLAGVFAALGSSNQSKEEAALNIDLNPTVPFKTTSDPKSMEIAKLLPDTGGIQVPVFDTLELVFTASSTPANPFDTYLLKLEVTDPAGHSFVIDGFFDGDGKGGQNGKTWRARLTPDQPGTWHWRTVQGDAPDSALQNHSGVFEAAPGSNLGGVVRDGKYFRFQNGDFIYLVGNFLDFANGLRTTHTYMSETTNDTQRTNILNRQVDFHTINKANIYFANKGDYDNQSVTPWLGSAGENDKTRMDLARWKKYDQYILDFKEKGVLAQMWFFADDSNFGALSVENKNRLARYAMARTSAFSHMMYVLALEWQEGWTKESVREFGQFVDQHNPWGRPLSVHNLTLTGWAFRGQEWATFIASQAGNDSSMEKVSEYTVGMYHSEDLPHLGEEFGILTGNSSKSLRDRMWATFTGGAAGSGTGSDHQALQRFLQQSRIPFQYMSPANNLVSDGGKTRFALAEDGHHYLVYTAGGGFTLQVGGDNLQGYWFNPREAGTSLNGPFDVSPGNQQFTPPNSASESWVLWVTDGSNLNSGVIHPTPGGKVVCAVVTGSLLNEEDGAGIEGVLVDNLADQPFRAFLPAILSGDGSGGGSGTVFCE